jgi:hypothetical protein
VGIELSDFLAENVMLKDNYLWQVAQILFGGVPTVLEIRCMSLFISIGRSLL